jgi:hypothetical protein
MNKAMVLGFALVASFSGCGSNNSAGTDGSVDDMTVAAMLSCSGLIDCTSQCHYEPDSAAWNVCRQQCLDRSTDRAVQLEKAMQDCLNAACGVDVDGGTGPCADRESPTCRDCINSAVAGTCAGAVAACIADTP